MNAVISGTAGRALLVDGKSLKSFDVDDPSKLVERKQSDLPYLFGEGRDLRVIENSDIASIATELKSDSALTLALDLVLISLDEELEDDIRKDALQDLDELLVEAQLRERLEGIMYARPLPDDADLAGALKFCDSVRLPNSFAFLEDLGRRQPLISKVSAAWDVIPTKVFGGYEQQSHFQRVAVQRGLFRSLVITLETPSPISKFLLNFGLNKAIQQLRNYRQVLQEWTTPFRQSGEAPTIRPEAEEEFERETVTKRRHGRRFGLNRAAVLKEVNKRKGIISAAIHRRDLARVQVLVTDLVDYQRENGEIEHAAKSLCDLAMEAKELGMFSLQLELTERSITIAPDDGWSWAQHGDALLNMQNLDEALRAYQQADAFGAGVIAKKGRAEVLKAKGQFDAALAAFDEVISQYPDDVVAKSGRAEVLKAQGQLTAALEAYEEAIREHPESAVAKTGRAEVLKAQGQFTAALAAFEEVIREYPDDIVAKTGRAEVLKAQGQLPAALEAYEAAIREHPEDAVAKNGRAEVLKAQGQFSAAVEAYEQAIREHPGYVAAKTGRAEALKAQGRFSAALAAYEEAILEHPYDVVAKSGRAGVLKARGELDAALIAYDEIRRRHPHNTFVRNGRGCVLAALGRYQEAVENLPKQNPISLADWIGYHIRGMVLLRTGNVTDAIRIFDEGVQNDPWPSDREYFRAALALAWLVGRRFKKATQVLEQVKAPLLQPAANVLRIHAFGAQGNVQRATVAYDSLSSTPYLRSNDLTQELRHQFILRRPPRRDEEWIVDREAQIILLAA
jgi:tetratricopeptide (TPR) repeat protein